MYEVQFTATSSADWVEAIELIDADTNGPLSEAADAEFALQVEDRGGCPLLSASTSTGTLTKPEPHIVRWIFSHSQLKRLCRGNTYRVGLTMTTAGGVTQLFVGTLSYIDGVVS